MLVKTPERTIATSIFRPRNFANGSRSRIRGRVTVPAPPPLPSCTPTGGYFRIRFAWRDWTPRRRGSVVAAVLPSSADEQFSHPRPPRTSGFRRVDGWIRKGNRYRWRVAAQSVSRLIDRARRFRPAGGGSRASDDDNQIKSSCG